MARKQIPLKDKETIKRRLAEGLSTREAIKGTAVKSNQTAARIAKQESHGITQIREKYLRLIESFDMGEIDRAKLWAEMARATKIFSSHTEPDKEVPDWTHREPALKYIDSLAGLKPQEEEKLPIAIQINFGSPEVDEWAK